MRLNWDDLHVFLALHRGGSLAAAARQMGVNPTTIGRRIGAFEAQLGTTLLARTPDGYVLTESGEAILEHAQHIEHHATLAANQVLGEAARLEGTVRLAITDDFASAFLIDHLGVLSRRHPGISLELVTGNFRADLGRGEADIAIRFSRVGAPVPIDPRDTDVRVQRVAIMGISAFASTEYLERMGRPERSDSFSGHELIATREGATHFPGYDWLRRLEDRNHVALRTDGLQGMTAAVAAGIGICAFPLFMALCYPNLERLTPPDTVDQRETWLMVPDALKRVARVRAVHEFIVSLLDQWEPMLSGRIDYNQGNANRQRKSAR